jgi:hypothetical protein
VMIGSLVTFFVGYVASVLLRSNHNSSVPAPSDVEHVHP